MTRTAKGTDYDNAVAQELREYVPKRNPIVLANAIA